MTFESNVCSVSGDSVLRSLVNMTFDFQIVFVSSRFSHDGLDSQI